MKVEVIRLDEELISPTSDIFVVEVEVICPDEDLIRNLAMHVVNGEIIYLDDLVNPIPDMVFRDEDVINLTPNTIRPGDTMMSLTEPTENRVFLSGILRMGIGWLGEAEGLLVLRIALSCGRTQISRSTRLPPLLGMVGVTRG